MQHTEHMFDRSSLVFGGRHLGPFAEVEAP
jgi:hypothetical protein